MKALVTGGGGFLGRRIVEFLVSEGHQVRFLARRRYPEVEALGARGLRIDLRDANRLGEAVEGIDTIFHVAGKAGFWGKRQEYFTTNVEGTVNLLKAARSAGARRLVYTSTPSVVGYDNDAEGVSEAPYAAVHRSFYPESKAVAEREVLAANGPHLATVAVRPHLIFGPGDNHLLPRVVQNARKRRMVIVGDGTNVVDMTYIDNAALAHLDAARALVDDRAACAGRAYFISNGEPVRLWEWMQDFLRRVGAPAVSRRMSLRAASTLGASMELTWRTFNLGGEPRMTRFLATALARAHWYDMGPAARDLGYQPRVSMDEGADRTVAWFLREEQPAASAV